MTTDRILSLLPYSEPFLFVEEIDEIHEKGVTGNYRFKEDSYFYSGHFKDHPVTPGVILTECMAQIGVVCLGIYLLSKEHTDIKSTRENMKLALSSSQVDFFLPVYPGEKVKVVSKKEYYRFNKLKCDIEMFNSAGKLVCRGKIAGMIITQG